MVSLRRFGALLVALGLALVVVIVRLYEVQVIEHPIWAREAANLMRSWRVEPYLRGPILDRQGRVWVRDEEVYELELVWRDFRRGHPLGQVAQMRSLVELRSVPLAEVHRDLVPTAIDLVRLSPAAIDAFGRGEALVLGPRTIPAVGGDTRRSRRGRAKLERRDTRAAELHWYSAELLGTSVRERRFLRDAEDGALWGRPYVELVARARGVTAEALEEQLETRLSASLVHLSELAGEIDAGEVLAVDPQAAGLSPFDRLLRLLAAKRREVEFAAADDLFEQAAGFPALRLDAWNLARIDLEWLRRALTWDRQRLADWTRDRGEVWPQAVERSLAGHVIARAKVERWWAPSGDRVLSSLACLFAAGPRTQPGSARPVPWWTLDELVVLDGFDRRFERAGTLPTALFEGVLPIQDPDLRAARAELEGPGLIERACAGTPGLPEPPAHVLGVSPLTHAARTLDRVAEQERPAWSREQELPAERVLLHWDALLQARVRTLFEHLPGGVALREGRVRAALEDRAYVVRDRESRPLRFDRAPSYPLVHLVTRHPEHYAGFRVRDATRRAPVAVVDPLAEEPRLLAEFLVGSTRAPYLVDMLRQGPEEAALRAAQRQLEIDAEQAAWIRDRMRSHWQPSAEMGGAGLEGYFDPELKGLNGYRENAGLTERDEQRGPVHVPAVDGLALTTTLDLDLQRALEEVLDAPDPPPDWEDKPDRVWHDHPVGAAVLMTVGGEVLAAASTPRAPAAIGPHQDGQRALALDRTLRMPGFHPPGSLFKPFVAAWGLERGWITPATPLECSTWPGDASRYGTHREGAVVHCLKLWGHGALADGGVTLGEALRLSCNAYFAGLGEHFAAEDVRTMARAFGFDQPTGVRSRGARLGLAENHGAGPVFRNEQTVATGPMRQRLGNGLSHISVTPMQVVRAYAALATGRKPAVRLVRAVGDVPQPATFERLPIADAHLDTVRAALEQVVISGTASGKGLGPDDLGFHLVCKTGSADRRRGKVPVDPRAPVSTREAAWQDGWRKHGWLAGWFPAHDPQVVLVVYCHDTSTTSSHIATHLARQILTHPTVRGWIEREVVR